MEISQFQNHDLPEVISLMRRSLGEELMPKSEAFFRWKHEHNVFGPSKILLAKDGGRIVGLRAFMYWHWQQRKEKIVAVRAVDTATDPEYQGKGIFRKLTMQAVEECKKEGADIVFNTPNPISLQGYLKMGWVQAGKMPLCFGPGSIIPHKYKEQRCKDLLNEFDIEKGLSSFLTEWEWKKETPAYHTKINLAYLRWRYAQCPVASYGMMAEPELFGFIFRIKPFRGFAELRICEAWSGDSNEAIKKSRAAFSKLTKAVRPLVVTSTATGLFAGKSGRLPLSAGPFKKGPMVTVRSLAREELVEFIGFSNWQPSIGAMEIF